MTDSRTGARNILYEPGASYSARKLVFKEKKKRKIHNDGDMSETFYIECLDLGFTRTLGWTQYIGGGQYREP